MTDNEKEILDAVFDRIVDFLATKARLERKPQFENNKSYLGGIAFYFTVNGSGTNLSFSQPVRTWNTARILSDIELQERTLLINSGINIHVER